MNTRIHNERNVLHIREMMRRASPCQHRLDGRVKGVVCETIRRPVNVHEGGFRSHARRLEILAQAGYDMNLLSRFDSILVLDLTRPASHHSSFPNFSSLGAPTAQNRPLHFSLCPHSRFLAKVECGTSILMKTSYRQRGQLTSEINSSSFPWVLSTMVSLLSTLKPVAEPLC
jgi:hypothetical protein